MDNRMMKIQNFSKCQVWRQSWTKRINFAHYLDVKKVLVDMTNFAKSFS